MIDLYDAEMLAFIKYCDKKGISLKYVQDSVEEIEYQYHEEQKTIATWNESHAILLQEALEQYKNYVREMSLHAQYWNQMFDQLDDSVIEFPEPSFSEMLVMICLIRWSENVSFITKQPTEEEIQDIIQLLQMDLYGEEADIESDLVRTLAFSWKMVSVWMDEEKKLEKNQNMWIYCCRGISIMNLFGSGIFLTHEEYLLAVLSLLGSWLFLKEAKEQEKIKKR